MDLLDGDQLSDMDEDDVSSDSSSEHLDLEVEEDSLGEVARSADSVGEVPEAESQKMESRERVVVTSLKLRIGLDRLVRNPTTALTTVMDIEDGTFFTLFDLVGIPVTSAADDVSRAFRKVSCRSFRAIRSVLYVYILWYILT